MTNLNTALAPNKRKLRRLLAAMPDAIVVISDQCVIRLANEQAERLLGYRKDELLDRPLHRLLPARFRSGHEAHIRRYLEEPCVRPMGMALDLWALRKDGTEVPVEISLSPYHEANGTVIIAAIRDITSRRQVENELRNSREQLSRAQRISGTGSFERDLRTGQVIWSAQTFRVFGLDEATLPLAKDEFLGLVHPQDREKYAAAMGASERGMRAPPIEFRIVRQDGSMRWVHSESDIIFDQDGMPARRVGTYRDITENKTMQLELLRSQENLARAQRIARIGSLEQDLVSGYASWSEELLRIFGIPSDFQLPSGRELEKFVHHDDRQKFIAGIEAALGGKSAPSLDYRIHRPDGSERVLHAGYCVDFDETDKPVRLFATFQDVTESYLAERRERELERQLLHSQKLEALGTLAGGIAHDLNNTLVPIMALSKVSARDLEPGNPLRSSLETIYEASQQARELVKRILAFSRKSEPEKKDCDLAEVVNEALNLMRATMPSSIQLESRINKVPVIAADASQIHQVVTNLTLNAVQSISHRHGKVTLVLQVGSSASGTQEISLSISDTGVGMDEGTQQRIFEPFFTTKSVGRGTGLGLSIVHTIVTGHGGRIEVQSEPGKGTRFYVYFPVPKAKASTQRRGIKLSPSAA